jgi:hypothetical protein
MGTSGDREQISAHAVREFILGPALNRLEEVGDKFTTELDQLSSQNAAIISELESLTDTPSRRSSFPFVLELEVPASTTRADPAVVQLDVPYDATITEVTIVSTDAAAQRVGGQLVSSSGRRWVPRNPQDSTVFLPLDDNPNSFTINVDVQEDDTLEAKYINTDTTDHYAATVVALKERGV